MIDMKNVRRASALGVKTLEFDIGSVASTTAVREAWIPCDAVELIDASIQCTGVAGGTYQYLVKTHPTAASTPEADEGTTRIDSGATLSALRHTTAPTAANALVAGGAAGTVIPAGLALKFIVTTTGGTPTRIVGRIRYRPIIGREKVS